MEMIGRKKSVVAKAAGCWRLLPTCRHPSSVSARFRGKKPSQVAAATRNSPGIARELLLPKTNQVHREKGKIQREGRDLSRTTGRKTRSALTCKRACAAEERQTEELGQEHPSRFFERRGDSPRLNSMGKTGSCGIAAEAGEAAGPPRVVGPEVSEPR